MADTQQKRKSAESGTESKVNTDRRYSIRFDPAEKQTRDSFKDEVDINNVIRRFVRTGELPRPREGAQYGEAPSQTLHEAACIQSEIASAEEEGLFDEPPSPAEETPPAGAERPVEAENQPPNPEGKGGEQAAESGAQ